MKTEHRFRKEKPRSVPSIHQNCAYLKAIKLENDVNFSSIQSSTQINMALMVEQQTILAPTITQDLAHIAIHLSNTNTFREKASIHFYQDHTGNWRHIYIYIFALKNEKKNQPQNPNEKPK